MPRRTSHHQLEAFLRNLARTGNFALAADQSGLAKSGLHKRKARDREFAKKCSEAVEAFRLNLSSPAVAGEVAARRADGGAPSTAFGGSPPPEIRGRQLLTTPGSTHLSTYARQPQIRRLPAGRLTPAGLTAFLATLAATCNVRLSAERVGVRHTNFYSRANRDHRFADAMDEAIAHAAFALECDLVGETIRSLDPDNWLSMSAQEQRENCDSNSELNERARMPADDPRRGVDRRHEGSVSNASALRERTAGDDPDSDDWPLPRITGKIGFHEALQLLILHRNAFGTPRTRHDRRQAEHNARYRPRELSDEEVRASLVKSLAIFGRRIAAEDDAKAVKKENSGW